MSPTTRFPAQPSGDDDSGGGGGGWYGGGSGTNGGAGGGGSAHGPAGTVFETGVRQGDGLVTVTYTPVIPTRPVLTHVHARGGRVSFQVSDAVAVRAAGVLPASRPPQGDEGR